uniref:Uncharacterized protein n=1 Tax=Tanacetum cinerariifolium TaxID=118510 RepID=A0A6L2KP43_TANCI|nr:hypothetical protein [Tanacetum cinerariifolium]
MGDFEAPSFSLGFDFDFDDLPEPQITPNNTSNLVLEAVSVADDGEFEIETLTVADSDDDENDEEVVRPRLKRLRRGCSVVEGGLSGSGKGTSRLDLGSVVVDDDDIEDFSSPEDNNAKGFDFDFDDLPEPQITPNNTSNLVLEAVSVADDGEFEIETLTVADSDDDENDEEVVRPRLKRLRRGCSVVEGGLSGSGKGTSRLDLGSVVVDDDDIEDFSSPEDNNAKDEPLPTPHYSVSNSSKFPLTGLGVLTRKSGKTKQNLSNVPESVITSCSKQPFPKLTVSPLRKFQLIDSDSDSDIPSISKVNKTCNKSEPYLNRGEYIGLNQPRKLSESLDTSVRKDLWEDFRHKKNFHIPTPALDEVCEEYFSSMKEKRKVESNIGKSNHNSHVMDSVVDLGDPRPPAHQYFFHYDLRVQELVRTRLSNFFPLNAENRGSEQPSTSNIDYMGQFSSGDKNKQAARTNKADTRSTRKTSRKSRTQETSHGFMNPKVDTAKGITKDAGKRRVQADGQGTGQWFTNGDGKKVYVSKNGQEMTGKAAYIHYKKESGGFKNKKAKKTSTKKK